MSLFKKFDSSDITGQETLKNSASRKIKNDLQERYPEIEENLDDIFPKKEAMVVYKGANKLQFICYQGEVIFFSEKNGPFLPTLRFVHMHPTIIPKLQVDRGAIPFVLKGAPIMHVGITSAGGKIFEDLPAKTVVQILAEGKQHPIAVGITTMSTQDMLAGIKKGAGVENTHFMGDGLWHNHEF